MAAAPAALTIRCVIQRLRYRSDHLWFTKHHRSCAHYHTSSDHGHEEQHFRWPHRRMTYRHRYRFQPGLPVSHHLECGSHAAAPAALSIRCAVQRLRYRSDHLWFTQHHRSCTHHHAASDHEHGEQYFHYPHRGMTYRHRYCFQPGLPVAHRLECGSHAAAPAVLSIRGNRR